MCGPSHLRRGTLLTTCVFFTVVAFILMLAGFVSPGWSYKVVITSTTPQGSNESHVGIWYRTVCTDSVAISGCATGELLSGKQNN